MSAGQEPEGDKVTLPRLTGAGGGNERMYEAIAGEERRYVGVGRSVSRYQVQDRTRRKDRDQQNMYRD